MNIFAAVKTVYCRKNKSCIYGFVGERVRMNKMTSWVLSSIHKKHEGVGIEVYERGLCLPLRLYYCAYLAFNTDKDKPFAEKIIEVVEDILTFITSSTDFTPEQEEEYIFELSCNYTLISMGARKKVSGSLTEMS